MNVRMMSFCLLLLLVLVIFGCSPSGDNKNTRQSPESMDVDRGFHELETNFGEGTLNPITCGRELLKKIERIPWPDERRHCLERFGDLILSAELGNGTYRERYLHLGVLEELHFLVANSNCGLPLDKRLEFRLAFLERIRREIVHPLPGPERDGHPPGLFITEDVFLKNLRDAYDLHLRWLEESFNRHAARELPPDACARLRAKIEASIGRRIRTDEEILRDRLRRPRAADTPPNRPGNASFLVTTSRSPLRSRESSP